MNANDRLLIEIIDRFADRFGKAAVLRGGMVLRVLGCERFTNDVDYVFVPFRSKKEVVEEVLETLGAMPGVRLEHSLNSKCLRVRVDREGTRVQVEIKTSLGLPIQVISNRQLVRPLGLQPRLLPVVDFSVALSDKMAAWNERRLMRDVYDIAFFLRMGIRPDSPQLLARLKKPAYSRLVKIGDRFPGKTVPEFYRFLLDWVNQCDDADVAESLGPLLPADELQGLALRLRADIARLAR